MNATELRNETIDILKAIRAGTLKPSEAKEMLNAVGKITQIARAQVAYYHLRKEEPEIDFLKDDRRPEGVEHG